MMNNKKNDDEKTTKTNDEEMNFLRKSITEVNNSVLTTLNNISKQQQQQMSSQDLNEMSMSKTQSSASRLDSEMMSLGFETPDNFIETGIGATCTTNTTTTSSSLTINDGPELYHQILRTICAIGIRCLHGRMVIKKLTTNSAGWWLPYEYVNNDECDKYCDIINMIVDKLSNNKSTINEKLLNNVQLYNIHRIQIPDGSFISRYIFIAQFNNSKICCNNSDNIQWHTFDELINWQKNFKTFWGNEIIMVANVSRDLHQSNKTTIKYPNISEFTGAEVMKYIIYNNNKQHKSIINNQTMQLLMDAKFKEKDVIKIFGDYVQHCYPSSNMTYCSFQDYMLNKMNLISNDESMVESIYRAFLCRNNQRMFIYFNEFLLGLAAMSSTNNDSQLRLGYIFRYYDQDCDNNLTQHDFKRIVYDIREQSMMSTEPAAVQKDYDSRLAKLNLFNDNQQISYNKFILEAANNHIPGIEQLFHANLPVLETIYSKHQYEFIANKSGGNKPFATKLLATCVKCRQKCQYSLAYNAVKINNTDGRIEQSKPLIQMNCGEIDVDTQFNNNKINKIRVKHSIDVVFNENSVANQVLSIIRHMINWNKMPANRKTELAKLVVEQLTTNLIQKLCRQVMAIFLIEPPVIKINSPCIVLGDIHGNINDLLTYERQLWPLAPVAMAPNILFLGDYVDRGDYSIEVVCYLFAMKILSPTKFFLLRGNHEIRSIQRNFTFSLECDYKYKTDGRIIFDEFNQVFDHLPLVGIIDESIYCAHGGIPYSTSKIEDLFNKIPRPLPEPELQSKIAWEILWSDPVTDEEFQQVCQFKNHSTDSGFVENLRRSTGYYFSEKATRTFLRTNNLSHVIRAHELELDGYRFRHSGQLITVFSSSRYCNTNNKSAAVFVNSHSTTEGFIKIIALQT